MEIKDGALHISSIELGKLLSIECSPNKYISGECSRTDKVGLKPWDTFEKCEIYTLLSSYLPKLKARGEELKANRSDTVCPLCIYNLTVFLEKEYMVCPVKDSTKK